MNQLRNILLFGFIGTITHGGYNNRTASTEIPGGLDVSNTPQFITITFDDSFNTDRYNLFTQINNHYNKNGQKIPFVFFLTTDYTEYDKVQHVYLEGSEIGLHTCTHTTSLQTDKEKWFYEITKPVEYINKHVGIPKKNLNGFRAPFLQINNDVFNILHGTNYKYDSTVANYWNDNKEHWWPYTWDKFDISMSSTVGETPKQSYPGLWEVPMTVMYYENDTMNDFMDYKGNYNTLLKTLKYNLMNRLNKNRAPFGIYLHFNWLAQHSYRIDALNDFISWSLSLNDNIWYVTNQQLLRWMNKPKGNDIINMKPSKYFRNWNRLDRGIKDCTWKTCPFNEGTIVTAQNTCPDTYPTYVDGMGNDKNEWTTVNIKSNNNAELYEYDICEDRNIPEWSSTEHYCAQWNGWIKVVKYNNNIYSCKWWSENNIPGISGVWEHKTTCKQEGYKFNKLNIKPFGTINVYQGYDLMLWIKKINEKYTLDRITSSSNDLYIYKKSYRNRGWIIWLKFSKIECLDSFYDIHVEWKKHPDYIGSSSSSSSSSNGSQSNSNSNSNDSSNGSDSNDSSDGGYGNGSGSSSESNDNNNNDDDCDNLTSKEKEFINKLEHASWWQKKAIYKILNGQCPSCSRASSDESQSQSQSGSQSASNDDSSGNESDDY